MDAFQSPVVVAAVAVGDDDDGADDDSPYRFRSCFGVGGFHCSNATTTTTTTMSAKRSTRTCVY